MTRPVRISVRAGRRMTIGFLWIASVLLAAGIGWAVGRFGSGDALWTAWAGAIEASRDGAVVDAGLPAQLPPLQTSQSPEPATVPLDVTPQPVPVEVPRPAPPVETRPQPAPVVEETIEAAEALAAAAEVEQPAEPLPGAMERAREVEQLAAAGASDDAGAAASALLTEHITYSELSAALEGDGAGTIEARLTALRILDLAGHASISRDVARELRREFAGSAEVGEAIRGWGILKPQISGVESSVEGGRILRVQGRIDNPDIVRVRKLRVRVEALDGAGAVLASEDVRVRPKLLEPGAAGTFSADFREIDPSLVLRTRTTVVEWESAITSGR